MNEYTCDVCHQTFKYAWSDEEAKKELEQNFGVSVEECGLVCDDCYKKMCEQAISMTSKRQ
jgi:hypothetical protein